MRLSTILELLLIFLLIAFAAYGRVIVPEGHGRGIEGRKSGAIGGASSVPSLKQAAENVNKYCVCNENICNCCRQFHIPLVRLTGPGCASLQYLQDEKLAMQLSIGDNILSSNIVNGKDPKPVCVKLPGGFSNFCGKIYSIQREEDNQHFKACLGLELRSASDVEASLRVSCFRFGPDGLKLRPAEPLPPVVKKPSTPSEDDYDDLFGLGDDDEDDDDEDDEDDDEEKISPEDNAVSGSSDSEPQDADQEEDDEDDLLGLSALYDFLSGDDESTSNKKKPSTTTTALPASFAIPILSLTSTAAPIAGNEAPLSKKPTAKPATSAAPASSDSSVPAAQPSSDEPIPSNADANTDSELGPSDSPQDATAKAVTDKSLDEATTLFTDVGVTEQDSATEESIKIAEANKIVTKIAEKIKVKKPGLPGRKKVTLTSQSVNAINNDGGKPQQPQAHHSAAGNDENEDDYDYENDSEADEDNEDADDSDEEGTDDENEEGDGSDKNVTEAEKNEQEGDNEDEDDDEDDDDDDDEESEEEEDAVLSALVDDDDNKDSDSADKQKKKNEKTTGNKTANKQDDDYSYELAELLARKQHQSRTIGREGVVARKLGRQSKVMRF